MDNSQSEIFAKVTVLTRVTAIVDAVRKSYPGTPKRALDLARCGIEGTHFFPQRHLGGEILWCDEIEARVISMGLGRGKR